MRSIDGEDVIRYGRWTVLGGAGRNAAGKRLLLCRCSCGREQVVRECNLKGGRSSQCQSCRVGNLGHRNISHGHSNAPEYAIWRSMKQRCSNPKQRYWAYYGGRGIRVCERWSNSFEAFLADVGRRPTPDHSIDRINNDGHYEPGNVRWATAIEQANNRRPRRAAAM